MASSEVPDEPPSNEEDGPACEVPVELAVGVLRDEDCRELLTVLDEQRTSADLAERIELPRPTVYAKLDKLVEANLVTQEKAVSDGGNWFHYYKRRFDEIDIDLGEESLSLRVRE